MKKIISGFLILTILSSVCVFSVSAQSEIIDEFNFETASEKVVITNNTFTYVARPENKVAVNPQNAYGALMSDASQSSKVKINFNDLYTNDFIYEMDFRLEDRISQAANGIKLVRFFKKNTESSLITLTDSTETGYKIRVCGKDENGNYVYVTGFEITGRLKYKTWYRLRVHIDVKNDVFSVFVDDYLVAENIRPYRNSFTSGTDNVIINTDSALDSSLLIDNISVKQELTVKTQAYLIYQEKIFGDFENIPVEELLANLSLPMYTTVTVYSDYAAKTVRTGNVEDGDVLEIISQKDTSNVKLYTLCSFADSNVYYVSPTGSDENDGLTPKTAFASLNMAKNTVHFAKSKQPNREYRVKILPGEYQMQEPVVFTKADSGTEEYPVIFERYGAGEAVFKGSTIIEKADPVTDANILNTVFSAEAKSKLMQIDLKAEGIRVPKMPDNYGYGAGNYLPLRVYINDKELTEARYPNAGDLMIPTKAFNNSDTYKEDGFYDLEYYDNDAPFSRTSRWNIKDRDIYIAGIIAPQWAYNHLRVKTFDPANRNIITATTTSDKPAIGRSYFWFTNILEEIDVPGESYIDEESGILYFYPYEDMTDAKIEVGVLDTEMLKLNDADYITFKNLNFEYSGRKILSAVNSDYLTIDGCTMAHTSENAMEINGHHTLILNCHIYDLAGVRGTGGIHLTGSGDRESLTSGESKIYNNKIHDTDVIYKVSQSPAIYVLDSVGTEISNNEIYNGTAYVVRITDCNDIVFKRNEVYNAVTMSSDAGALTWGRDITLLGFKVIENYFHDIGNDIGIREQESTGQVCKRTGQQALFHDDGSSGPYAYGNIFYQTKPNGTRNTFYSIKANGGQYGVWENNIFIGGDAAGYFGSWRTGYTKYQNDSNVQDMWWLRNYNVYERPRKADGAGDTAIYWDRISNPNLNFFENEIWKEKYSEQYGAYWTLFTPEKKEMLEAAYDPAVTIKNNKALLDAAAAEGELLLYTNAMKNNVLIDTITPYAYNDTANYYEVEGSAMGVFTSDVAANYFADYGTDFTLTQEGLAEIKKIVPAFESVDFSAIGYKEADARDGFFLENKVLKNENACMDIINLSNKEQSGILVVTAYCGDEIKDIKLVAVHAKAFQTTPMQIPVSAQADSFKVYILRDFFSMQIFSNILEQ